MNRHEGLGLKTLFQNVSALSLVNICGLSLSLVSKKKTEGLGLGLVSVSSQSQTSTSRFTSSYF